MMKLITDLKNLSKKKKLAIGVVSVVLLIWVINQSSVWFGGGGVLPISEVTCEMLSDNWDGEKLENSFGAENEIFKISDPVEVSRDEKELVCRGKGKTERGDLDFLFNLTEDSDGDRWHQIEVID